MKSTETKRPEKQNYATESRELRVTGTLWGGAECEHSYPVPEGREPATLAEAKRLAPDFSSLESARLVTIKRRIVGTITEKELS